MNTIDETIADPHRLLDALEAVGGPIEPEAPRVSPSVTAVAPPPVARPKPPLPRPPTLAPHARAKLRGPMPEVVYTRRAGGSRP